MTNIDRDFLSALSEIQPVIITQEIWDELKSFYPDRYKGLDYIEKKINEESLTLASEDYLKIVKSYMSVNGVPILIETLTVAYLWGINNLINKGLQNAPKYIKKIVGQMWHTLEPQNEQLKSFL